MSGRPDITKRLAENAHVLEAHQYATAAATMREAAAIIEGLRAEINASWGVAGARVTGSDDVT